MAQLGTGVQLAAIGPQNEYLDVRPEVTAFYNKATHSTRFASEAMEDLPLQTVGFGSTATFELPPRGDLLGDMHIQMHIPALQPALGSLPRLAPEDVPAVTGPQTGASSVVVPSLGVSVALHGFAASGYAQAMADGRGTVWFFGAGAGVEQWTVCVYNTGYIVSTLASNRPRNLLITTEASHATLAHAPNGSVGAVVTSAGAVLVQNDMWRSPLAYVMMRRVKFVVDELQVYDHERLWYDLHDRLTMPSGRARGHAEMLGTDLSLGSAHTIVLPLKFMSSGQPRAYFPVALIPKCRVKVELQVEAFANCVSSLSMATSPPKSLNMRLVAEHITLDREERNAMLLKPVTLMYEGAQDMDALNYVEGSDGTPSKTATAVVDLSELNLPVKALAWVVYREATKQLFEYLDVVETATLLLGSTERFAAHGTVCSMQQPHSHMPRCPSGNVYSYSFALNAFGKEPSGAFDFSVVQKPVLRLGLKPEAMVSLLKAKVWGITYNWLTFEKGKVTRMFST